MVTVTDSAKEELKRILETRALAPGKMLRLAMPPGLEGGGRTSGLSLMTRASMTTWSNTRV